MMNLNEKNALMAHLSKKYADVFVDAAPPKAYIPNEPSQVRAIVLGTDPGNRSKDRFEYVFGIGGTDDRYYRSTEKNLKKLGLEFDDCYVSRIEKMTHCRSSCSCHHNLGA